MVCYEHSSETLHSHKSGEFLDRVSARTVPWSSRVYSLSALEVAG
jgi:hypothetical protein